MNVMKKVKELGGNARANLGKAAEDLKEAASFECICGGDRSKPCGATRHG